jgi:indoleamine 2,3-dioxygenase
MERLCLRYVQSFSRESFKTDVCKEMYSYMPSEHRQFLNAVAKLPSLGEYVSRKSGDDGLAAVYNECLQRLSDWRSRHIGVVTTHIVSPSRKEHRLNSSNGALNGVDDANLQGTGGSALIPFLKQARLETIEAQV